MDQSIRDLKHKEYNSIFTSNWLEINKRQANYHLLSNCKTINLDEAKTFISFSQPFIGEDQFCLQVIFCIYTVLLLQASVNSWKLSSLDLVPAKAFYFSQKRHWYIFDIPIWTQPQPFYIPYSQPTHWTE